jgi:hypothetical protein
LVRWKARCREEFDGERGPLAKNITKIYLAIIHTLMGQYAMKNDSFSINFGNMTRLYTPKQGGTMAICSTKRATSTFISPLLSATNY